MVPGVTRRSFSEKDIIAKATFDSRPSQANAQKRAFRDQIDAYVKTAQGTRYTDITGGRIQGAESLDDTGAGHQADTLFLRTPRPPPHVPPPHFPTNPQPPLYP